MHTRHKREARVKREHEGTGPPDGATRLVLRVMEKADNCRGCLLEGERGAR